MLGKLMSSCCSGGDVAVSSRDDWHCPGRALLHAGMSRTAAAAAAGTQTGACVAHADSGWPGVLECFEDL